MLAEIVKIAGSITTIAAALVLLIKPIRNQVFGLEKIQNGQRCLLRADMLKAYYNNKSAQKIRQYEYENFLMEYTAYKALKGNSFIDKIKIEVDDWEVIS